MMIINPPSKRIHLSVPEFDGKESRYIHEAFQSGQIATSGSFIEKFEDQLEREFGGENIVALNSGTSAIHLGLQLLDVGRGDEVICQSLTFAASANPIVYLGAQPIFVDSESDTWNICPQLLEEVILDRISKGKLPKAIVTVNLFGMPAKMKEIMEVAHRYGIPVLEDAAESVGSRIHHRYCGTFGDIGVFSFNGNKVITTGGGGALVTSNDTWTKRARHLATQAKENHPHYEHSSIGYNYKMNNLAAGIGLAQLGCLKERIAQRRRIFSYYQNALENIAGISFLKELPGYFSNRWLTTVLINPSEAGFDRETLRLSLESRNIESKPIWKPMHLQPVFRQSTYYGGEIAAGFFANGLCLPSSSNLTVQELDRVTECLMLLHQGVFK